MSLWLCKEHHPVKGRRKRNKKHNRKVRGKCGDCQEGDVTVWHKYPKLEHNDTVHENETGEVPESIPYSEVRKQAGLPDIPDPIELGIEGEKFDSVTLDDIESATGKEGPVEKLETCHSNPVEKSAVEETLDIMEDPHYDDLTPDLSKDARAKEIEALKAKKAELEKE